MTMHLRLFKKNVTTRREASRRTLAVVQGRGSQTLTVEPLYRFVDGENGEIVVFPDKVVFRARSSGSEDERSIEISRRSLISVMNRRAPEEWAPDIVVVLYRDEQGALDYFVWSLAEKNVSRKVSNEIYKVIDNGFLKSVFGFFYTVTHPLRRV